MYSKTAMVSTNCDCFFILCLFHSLPQYTRGLLPNILAGSGCGCLEWRLAFVVSRVWRVCVYVGGARLCLCDVSSNDICLDA